VSLTTTENVQLATMPLLSTAYEVTLVEPKANGWLTAPFQRSRTPQLSAACAKGRFVTFEVHVFKSVLTFTVGGQAERNE
jgi:hypothetical protein